MNQDFYDENMPYDFDQLSYDEDDAGRIGLLQALRNFFLRFSPRIISIVFIGLIILVAYTISDWKYNHTDPVVFSQTVEADIPVYADIISMEPVYGIYTEQVRRGRHYDTRSHFMRIVRSAESGYDPSNDLNYPNCGNLVCKCETVDGTVIWVKISRSDYEEAFDPAPTGTGQRPIATLGSASFETPVRLLGKAYETEDVADGFERMLNDDLVIFFKSVPTEP